MHRIFAALIAFLALTGFSEQDALDRFGGGWQMNDEVHGTVGAIQIDPESRTIRATAYNQLIEGPFQVDVVGASAIFRVGEKLVTIYNGPDQDSIDAGIGSMPTMRFDRVP